MAKRREKERVVEISLDELVAVLDEVKAKVCEAAFEKISAVVDAYRYLLELLERRSTTLRRLRRIVFGPQSEKTKDVCKTKQPAATGDGGQTEAGAEKGNTVDDEGAHVGSGSDPGRSKPEDATPESTETDDKQKPRPDSASGKAKTKGHGCNPASSYHGAETTFVPHPTLRGGMGCPLDCRGRLRGLTPAVIVRITGGAPLPGRRWLLERLRCNLCGAVFTAPTPPEVGERKYDELAGSMLAVLHYGTGMPLFRLAKLQRSLGIPLPPSTQWDVLVGNVPKIYPVFALLLRLAACGKLLHNDDTTMRILELIAARKRQAAQGKSKKGDRHGVFTSGIVALNGTHKIALFFTGNKHAGERLEELLHLRDPELGPPIQMADALPQNVPKGFATILANCLAHGRRQFVDVEPIFPDEVEFVLGQIRQVYKNDEQARLENMSDAQRLRFHQLNSGPIMGRLRRWMRRKIANKEVEPNGSLGAAFNYIFKHWSKLTLFLRVPGAPLDNTLVERALKKAIMHRKSSSFYKTTNGAWVGDIYMSLIHTAELAGADPFDYLAKLLTHCERVAKDPEKWLPWNYEESVARLSSEAA